MGGYGKAYSTAQVYGAVELAKKRQGLFHTDLTVGPPKAWSNDLDRIVMSHGEVIDSNGKDILKECYAWLLNKLNSQSL